MTPSLRIFAAALLAASLVSAQQLCVTVSPNPAPQGVPITVTAQAAVPGLYTPFGCLISSVRSGAPNGPQVGLFGCTFLSVAIPTYGSPTSRTGVWNQTILGGGTAAPGVYWFQIDHVPGQFGSPTTTEWYSVTITDPVNPTPVLAAVNTPNFGSTFEMSLTGDSVRDPFAGYGVALSFTTNTGIPYAGGVACLDPDALFDLSLAQPANLFVNFQGALNYLAVNNAPIQILIPSIPGILVVPIHAQAVVFPASGGFVLTNDLNIHIH
jgi:hypothetical protein